MVPPNCSASVKEYRKRIEMGLKNIEIRLKNIEIRLKNIEIRSKNIEKDSLSSGAQGLRNDDMKRLKANRSRKSYKLRIKAES